MHLFDLIYYLNTNRPITEIESVMQSALNDFDCDEITGFARIVHKQSVLLESAELKSDVDLVVGLHLGQTDICCLEIKKKKKDYEYQFEFGSIKLKVLKCRYQKLCL